MVMYRGGTPFSNVPNNVGTIGNPPIPCTSINIGMVCGLHLQLRLLLQLEMAIAIAISIKLHLQLRFSYNGDSHGNYDCNFH